MQRERESWGGNKKKDLRCETVFVLQIATDGQLLLGFYHNFRVILFSTQTSITLS